MIRLTSLWGFYCVSEYVSFFRICTYLQRSAKILQICTDSQRSKTLVVVLKSLVFTLNQIVLKLFCFEALLSDFSLKFTNVVFLPVGI